MFLFDWVWYLLFKWGFISKKATILLLGLDNAGKTTLLYKLKFGEVRLVIPTQRAQLQEIDFGNIKFRTWDLGGHAQVRAIWRDYFPEADAIVFMVDSADTERLEEAKVQLHSLLEDTNLSNVHFLILANKIDIETALNREQLVNLLGLDNYLSQESSTRQVQLFRCSLVEGTGYGEGLNWLADIL
mmetsp:Transcript_4542/g.6342  ORF Transcript_4542/g.6342 Transcript_4542/m.6342 type:complete len:186 (+) Transcript_4542:70-627(+)